MKYVIGIDEVGRGALAGPVVVAAVVVPNVHGSYPRHLPKLRDSKGLSPKQREAWYSYVQKNPQILFASARVYQRGIERLNISRSANLAASRALDKLLKQLKISNLPAHRSFSEGGPLVIRNSSLEILLDGGLYLGNEKHRSLKSKTIVHGDQKRNPIKLASIVAKVTRDRYLNTLDGRYPGYGLGRHKGYGTKKHFRAIQEHGVLRIHRKTFLKRISNN